MICPGCGENVGDNEKFCRRCGASLKIEKKKKFCGQCGNELSDSDVFCGKCGALCKTEVQTGFAEFFGGNEESLNPDELEKTISIEDLPERWYKPGDDDRESSVIPEEEENRSAVEMEEEEPEEEEGGKKKKRGWLIALAAILILLAAGTGVTAVMLFSPDDNIVKQVLNFDQEKAEEKDADVETLSKKTEAESLEDTQTETALKEQETTAVSESSTEESSTEETEKESLPNTITPMDYVNSDVKNFPSSPEDFTEVKSPDGAYTLKYPKNFFKTGSYNSENRSYQFSTADGQISMEIWEEEAQIKDDPQNCANSKLEQYRSLFMVTEDSPYIFESKQVAESGFSRSVIAGSLKSDITSGKYIVTACNKSTTYTLIINYYALDSTGAGVDYTPTGYLLDCIYRGWSISGSTYQLRTYDQYMKDEMGSKK